MHNYFYQKIPDKKIYLGGGFTDAQLLWIMPIVYGYCKKKKINSIILENKLSEKLFEEEIVVKIFQDFKVFFLKKNFLFFDYKLILFFLTKSLKIINLFFFLTKKDLIKKKFSWFDYQCYHSIFDLSQLDIKDGKFKIFFFSKFISILKVYLNIYLAKKIINDNVITAFLGHSVYGSRAMMATLRENNIKIFNQAFDSLYKQKILSDILWNFPDKKNFLIFIKNKIIIKESNKYWNKRILGIGNYEDSNLAFSNEKKISKKEDYKNIVMLHIFRDSPFNSLDKKRIFFDYYDWMLNTLLILKDTDECWTFKEHPSAYKWGEDSYKTFQSLYNEVYRNKICKHIKYIKSSPSNRLVFKNVRRMVTYSGTSHLEAACFGIKPIVISKVPLGLLDKKMIIKPKSIEEYKKCILTDVDQLDLKLTFEQKIIAKGLLFYNENILTLKNNLNSCFEYRNDSNITKEMNFYNIKKKIKKNKKFLFNLGTYLATNLNNTISKNYLRYLNKI
jgi:hypothetical protein